MKKAHSQRMASSGQYFLCFTAHHSRVLVMLDFSGWIFSGHIIGLSCHHLGHS